MTGRGGRPYHDNPRYLLHPFSFDDGRDDKSRLWGNHETERHGVHEAHPGEKEEMKTTIRVCKGGMP